MDTKVYYDHKNPGLLITSNFAKYQKQIELGLFPNADFMEISILDIERYSVSNVAFDEIDNLYFHSIKDTFFKYKLGDISIHNSKIDLSDVVLNVRHLIIGDNSKIDLSAKNFTNLEEITFLSVKTFKGKILDRITNVKKVTLWYENGKANAILSMFPNLVEFWINNGSTVELVLTKNPLLEILHLNRCTKLERVILGQAQHLKTVIAEGSKKLDTSNLGDNVAKV